MLCDCGNLAHFVTLVQLVKSAFNLVLTLLNNFTGAVIKLFSGHSEEKRCEVFLLCSKLVSLMIEL